MASENHEPPTKKAKTTKRRFNVSIFGSDIVLAIPFAVDATVGTFLSEVQERATRSKAIKGTISELRIKQTNALLDPSDIIEDVVLENEHIVAFTNASEQETSTPPTPTISNANSSSSGVLESMEISTQTNANVGNALTLICRIFGRKETLLGNVSPSITLLELKKLIAQTESIPINEVDRSVQDTIDIFHPANGFIQITAENCVNPISLWGINSQSNVIYVNIRKNAEDLIASNSNDNKGVQKEMEQGSMRIFIGSFDGEFQIHAEASETVGQLKRRIQAAKGTPVLLQRIIKDGKILDDSATLSSYNIQLDSKLFMTKATNSKPQGHRLEICNAWQPIQAKQGNRGMSCFLSCLYVWTSFEDNQAKKVLGLLRTLSDFPPAILALKYLFSRSNIHDAYKSALSSFLWSIFRNIVPKEMSIDANLFESTQTCIGVLLMNAKDENSALETYTEISLNCSATFEKLKDPVCLKGKSDNKYYNRAALLAKHPEDQIEESKLVIGLLSANPERDSVTIYNGALRKFDESSTSWYDNNIKCVDWNALKRRITDFINANAKSLRIVPALSLMTAAHPVLTYDKNSNIVVCTGPEACSVGTVVLFCPVTKESPSVNPDILAKQLQNTSAIDRTVVDERETKEAIMVLLDSSSSMCGFSFGSEHEEEDIAIPELTAEQIDHEIQQFSKLPTLNLLRKIAQSTKLHLSLVINELSSQSRIMAAVLKKITAERRIKDILMMPIPVENKSDDNSNPKIEKPSQAPSMQIFVRSFSGKTVTIDVHPSYTIGYIKQLLSEKLDTKQDFSLTFAGRTMSNDEATLEQHNVQKESTLFLLYRLNNVNRTNRKITVKFEGRYEVVEAQSAESIEALKLRIWEKIGKTPSSFTLWKGLKSIGDGWTEGTLLEEDDFLYSYVPSGESEVTVSLGRPKSKRDRERMTRLQTVQQLFHAYINRSQAYNYPNQIGLILFDSTVNYACPITPLFEVFRDKIDNAVGRGDTSLYDALMKAGELLSEFSKTHKNCSTRIICLSDGEDTKSTNSAHKVAYELQKLRVVVDSIMIGEGANNRKLKAISKATGGYAFAPGKLGDALKLCELETLLSLHERPDISPNNLVMSEYQLLKYADLPMDICNENIVPTRRSPNLLKEPVRSAKKTLEKADDLQQNKTATSASRIRKILEELKKIINEPHEAIEVFPCQRNIGFWRIILKGPPSSPYKNGTWLLYANFPEDYPVAAPEVRFVTPVKHCNVNPYGKICHSIFTRNWSADTSMKMVLDCVYGLLLYPETDDPLDSSLALQFFNNPTQYENDIQAHVTKHASGKSMEQYRQELLENEDELDDDQVCKICAGRKISICFVPCGHMCSCDNCSMKVNECPVCRQPIKVRQQVRTT